tara:strand:- start:65 stop:439 length:375 start_codon:yes stop_codon:yes gene_type:complete
MEYVEFMNIYERVCQLKEADVYIVKNWAFDDHMDDNLFEMHIKYKNDNFFIGWNEYGSFIFIDENGLLANLPWHNGGYYDMKYYCDGEVLNKELYKTQYTSICQIYSNMESLTGFFNNIFKSYL